MFGGKGRIAAGSGRQQEPARAISQGSNAERIGDAADGQYGIGSGAVIGR